MTYALTQPAMACLRAALSDQRTTVALVDLERPAGTLRAQLHIEHEADKLAVLIAMEQTRHTMRLQAGDPANAQHLREQIEAIANGTADTAATGAIGASSAPARPPFALGYDDEVSLRTLVRQGGTRHLLAEATVTVHRPFNCKGQHALVTTPASTAHLQAATPRELYGLLAEHIETALNAA